MNARGLRAKRPRAARLPSLVIIAVWLVIGPGCAYFNPKYAEPSQAEEGMKPPPGGYFFGENGLADVIVGGLNEAAGNR